MPIYENAYPNIISDYRKMKTTQSPWIGIS